MILRKPPTRDIFRIRSSRLSIMEGKSFPQKPRTLCVDIGFHAVIVVSVWVASVTLLSPVFLLLVVSTRLRSRFFSVLMVVFNVFITKRFEKVMELRQALFDRLRAGCPSGGGLRILEIGVGPGANFRFYRPDDVVTLLDKNPHFQSAMEAELKKYPNVRVDKFVIGVAEDMSDVGDGEYDVVFGSYVFCSVSDRTKTMAEIKRVLKTGGKLAFVEHVGFPKGHLVYYLQKIFWPMWYIYCNGCRLDRCWRKELRDAFSDSTYDVYYPPFFPLLVRPHAILLATK